MMTVEKKEAAAPTPEEAVGALDLEIVNLIRTTSEAGRIVTLNEVFEGLVGKGLLKSEDKEDRAKFGTLLKDVIKNNEDLREISGKKAAVHYYSQRSMTEAYARILIQKVEGPLTLMAETIRENSRRYPRPVRLDIFEEPPFDLTPEEISLCLKTMAEQEAYHDIQQTTTSIGTIFLYSKLHLEPDYASMLAEWVDVGQSKSP
jgi:hypothetical protein